MKELIRTLSLRRAAHFEKYLYYRDIGATEKVLIFKAKADETDAIINILKKEFQSTNVGP